MRPSRREFVAATIGSFAAASSLGRAQTQPRIVDIHQHTRYNQRPDEYVAPHQRALGVTTSVLLAGDGWMLSQLGANSVCSEFAATHDGFVRFACCDPARADCVDVLRKEIRAGALGIGEMKFEIDVDGPEMRRVYDLAEETRVPVLLHFWHQTHNKELPRLEPVLKKYPRVNFIGHAQSWWGAISADLVPTEMYPKGPVKPGGLTDRLLSDYPNLYGDLSAGSGLNALTRDPDFTRGFLTRHADRLLWGSDCDCRDGKGGGVKRGSCLGAEILAAVRRFAPDDGALEKMLSGNATRLLRIGRRV
jgi:predicted TIM-barrel fold metal-dependent hydrolase